MGEQGLKDELTEAGISSIGFGSDPFPDGAPDKLIPEVPRDSSIRAVIVGYDHFVSLPKLVKVSCNPFSNQTVPNTEIASTDLYICKIRGTGVLSGYEQ